MKRIFILCAIVCAILSCNKENDRAPQMSGEQMGSILVSLDGIELGTKATSAAKETTVSDGQLLMYNSKGDLYRYQKLTAAEISAMKVTVQNIKVGSYTLALVVNGPDFSTDANKASAATLIKLKAVTLPLKDHNGTGTDFVMFGTKDVTVNADATANAEIIVSRNVGRVVVSSIMNKIPAAYGNLTINSIMLTNVYANVCMAGDTVKSGAVWYNMEGRSDTSSPLTSSHIIDGGTYKSQCPDLTYQAFSSGNVISNGSSFSTPVYLYGYTNPSKTAPTQFVANYPAYGYKTCMVIKATFNGETWYYPVVLNDFKKNTSYSIAVTIIGEGSKDPNEPVKKGSASVSIKVADWTTGTSYTPTI